MSPALVETAAATTRVVIYPTAAHFDVVAQRWRVPVHGWMFDPNPGSVRLRAAARLLRRYLWLEPATPETATFRERAGRFVVTPSPPRTLNLHSAGAWWSVGPTDREGRLRGLLHIPVDQVRRHTVREYQTDWLPLRVSLEPEDPAGFDGAAQLVPPQGVSVVSDIDDTVKESCVAVRRELLANTFTRRFTPMPGIPDAYRQWAEQGACFHYVSSSPWQLFEALQPFLDHHGIPAGSMDLKTLRLRDLTLPKLLTNPGPTKQAQIEHLLHRFPHRRFVLIGDNGERDPEIYGHLARHHPDRVRRVLIHNVLGETRFTARLRRAFAGVPADRWRLYRHGEELQALPLHELA